MDLVNGSYRRIFGQSGFTLTELLVVMTILGVLSAIAVPSFLGYTEPAADQQAKTVIYGAHEAAKGIWIEDDNTYVSTEVLLTKLTPGEPAYIYRADLPETSYSIDPRDVSVTVEPTDVITLCSRSTTMTVYCARWDEMANMITADTGPAGEPPSPDGNLLAALGPDPAQALTIDASAPNDHVAYSRGYGAYAEQDAIAALPNRAAPQTCFAGPGNTGMPSWDNQISCPEPLENQPPDVQITAGPDGQVVARDGTIAFSTDEGGPVDTVACKLDNVTVPCVGGSYSFTNLSYGGHTFEVTVAGPGGNDADSRAWQIVSPPHDRVALDGSGDYADVPLSSAGGWKTTGNDVEMGAWVKLDALPPAGQLYTVLANGEPNVSDGAFQFSIDSNGMLFFSGWEKKNNYFQVLGNTEYKCSITGAGGSTAPITPGGWNYVSAIWAKGSNAGLYVYLNNKLQGCYKSQVQQLEMQEPGEYVYVGAQLTNNGAFNSARGNVPGQFYAGEIAVVRLTIKGAPCYVVSPGPLPASTIPSPRLYSPAENGRTAAFLYDFEQTWANTAGPFGALTPHGNAHLAGG